MSALKEDRLRRKVAKMLGMKPLATKAAIVAEVRRRLAQQRGQAPLLSAELSEVIDGQSIDLAGLARHLAQAMPRAQIPDALSAEAHRRPVALTEPLEALRSAGVAGLGGASVGDPGRPG